VARREARPVAPSGVIVSVQLVSLIRATFELSVSAPPGAARRPRS
jgi:hypothetical protein